MKILLFIENGFEDLELLYPKYRLQEEGAQTVIAGVKALEQYKGKNGYPCKSDISFDDVKIEEYAALVIPGGYAPDKLRMIPKAIEIIRKFDESRKTIAFICHAGSLLISANVIKGIKCTSYQSIKDDMINAGADWRDDALVVDQHFISSRFPADLPKFCPAIIESLKVNGVLKEL